VQLDPPVLLALLLLVMPPLAVVCTLLTGPVAGAIGRRQHEEEQVRRAPVFVAGTALVLEACLAMLLRALPASGSHPFPLLELGALRILVDTYALAVVVGLSVVALLALVSADLSRATLGELRTLEVAGILFVWAANVALAMAANLRMVALGVFLSSLAISVVLLIEAWRQPRAGRIWLVTCSVLWPLVSWGLLGACRELAVGGSLGDDRSFMSQAPAKAVRSSLVGLWLAGGWLIALAPLVIAATPRRARTAFPSAGLLYGVGLVGTLPAVFRATTKAFPAGPYPDPFYRYAWLSPRMAVAAVALGLAALALAQVRLGPFRRLCLVGFGCLCFLSWAATDLSRWSAEALLLQAILAGALLPVALAAVSALEHPGGPARPLRLPRSSATVLPILACIPWAWPAIVAAGRPAPHIIGGLLLSALLLVTAARVTFQVRALAGRPPAPWREALFIAALIALGLVLAGGFLWPDGLPSLGPPIP
jgi:hypothetical protein